MRTTPAMQSSKGLFANHRLTLFMMLGVLLMFASSILIFRIGNNSYEQALSVYPLASAVLLLILSPVVWQHEEAGQKISQNLGKPTQRVHAKLKAVLKKNSPIPPQAQRK